jgi:hypothetical protein
MKSFVGAHKFLVGGDVIFHGPEEVLFGYAPGKV